MIAATAILALGIIPYGRNMTPFAIDGGILFFFAVGSDHRTRGLHGRLGQQQQILHARRDARDRADGELRIAAHHHGAAGRDGRRLAFAGCDRRRAKRLHVRRRAALVCLHALGRGGVSFVFCFRSGRIEPHSFRCSGRRIRNRCGPYDGILRIQIRHLLPRRILRHVCDQRTRGDAFPRRLACADRCPPVHSLLRLVLRQTGACFSSFSSGFAARSRACASIRS